VRDVAAARDALFKQGVETGTTNLMDLAQATGVDLPHARALKERCIFIPLHANLTRKHYRAMFQTLRAAGQI
jgi:dTDP-4-amino-4,6-dideoxygalactose transaminase